MRGVRWTLPVACSLLIVASCNHPPDTPEVPYGSWYARIGSTYCYTTGAVDPDGDDVSCRMMWTVDDTSDWSAPVASGAPCSLYRNWDRHGLFYVSAQARDEKEKESDWSFAISVSVGYAPTTPGAPLGPSTAQPGRPYEFRAVAWSNDPERNELRYVFNWGPGKFDTTALPTRGGDTVSMFNTFYYPGEYDVRVKAFSYLVGTPSDWSEPLRVVIDSFGALRWKTYLGGELSSSPLLDTARGRLYVGSTDGAVYCVDTGGSRLWAVITRDEVTATPALDEQGRVIVGSEDDTLYCIDPDGNIAWRRGFEDRLSSSAATGPDSGLYLGCDDGFVHVRAPGSGEWLSFETGGDVNSSPAVGPDGRVYVGSDDKSLYCLSPACSLLWSYEVGGKVTSSPAVAPDGMVYVGSHDDYLYCFYPDGSIRWRVQTGGKVESSPVIGPDTTIYFGSEDDYVYALRPDGNLAWRHEADGSVTSTPVLGETGRLYFGTSRGRLYALDPGGRLIWTFSAEDNIASSPVLGPDSTVYFGADDGCLYAVRTAMGMATDAPWPMFRRDMHHTGRVRP